MKFGVNYTPRRGWFHHWMDFDPSEVARDFDTIARIGVDHVRIFPLWPVFQPNASMVSESALRHLDTVIELAAERNLQVSVDGLQGHLSSFDFLPAWLVTWHRRNMFTDPSAIEATANYLRRLAEVTSAHPNVFALTVGNEVNQFSGGVHPDPHPATPVDITAWLDTMIGALRAGSPRTWALNASYDASWFEPTQPFTLDHVAHAGDATIVHSWVFNGTAQRYGPDAFETHALARYLIEVARAFHSDPARPVWLQEVGAPRNVLPAESVEPFIRGTVEHLRGAENLFGVTWWASHDVSRDLADFPELEYDLGLIDEHGEIKPDAWILRDAVADAANADAPGTTAASLTLDIDPVHGRAALAPGGEFFERYMSYARTHGHPRVVCAVPDRAAVSISTVEGL